MSHETVEHRGSRIELVGEAPERVLLIDGEPLRWGRFPSDGQYFLYGYAYDPDVSLIGLAKRYIEYRGRVQQVRATNRP